MAVKKQVREKLATGAAQSEQAAAVPADDKAVTTTAKVTAAEEINVEDFGRLVAGMSRLLVGFGELKPLREAGMGLGEWVALGMVARQEGMTNRLMSRSLGVPVQRVAQITGSLAQSGLILVGTSGEAGNPEGGKAGKMVKITDAGKTKLEAINTELKSVLGAVLKARTLGVALRQMKPLGRVLRAATPDRPNRKKGKKGKRAEGAPDSQASPAQA